ncbi:MAG: hypothetical protein ACI4TX_00710 [Christensenellales bacterium]
MEEQFFMFGTMNSTLFIIFDIIFSLIFIAVTNIIIISVVKTLKSSKKNKEFSDVVTNTINKSGKKCVCPYCGVKNNASNEKCTNCGATL